MKRYPELLKGEITLQDLTDHELIELRKCWVDGSQFHPAEEIWNKARLEQERREAERAKRKAKPIDRNFF